MKKFLYLFVVVALLVIPINVNANRATIPAHTQDFYINDFAHIIDTGSREYIMQQSIKLEEASGAQVVVVTINTIDNSPLEEFSLDLLRNWGIGSKDKNNGVLILVVVDDRQSRIEVGYGLEGALPDSKTGWIQDEYMIPHFSSDNYSDGIIEGYKAILFEIYKEYNLEPQDLEQPIPPIPIPSDSPRGGFLLLPLIIGFILFDLLFLKGRILNFLILMFFAGRRGGPRGGGGWGSGGGGFGGGGFRGGGGSGGGGGSSRGW